MNTCGLCSHNQNFLPPNIRESEATIPCMLLRRSFNYELSYAHIRVCQHYVSSQTVLLALQVIYSDAICRFKNSKNSFRRRLFFPTINNWHEAYANVELVLPLLP